MVARRGSRWSHAVAVVGVALWLAGVGRLVVVWVRHGPIAADNEASVLGTALAASGAALALLSWVIRRHRADGRLASAEEADHAAATLAELVREQWTAEAQARALNDPVPMPVRWRLAEPSLMDHRSVITPYRPLEFAGRSDRIKMLAAAFRELPRRRLVIIGAPGTGKTTLAMQLLLELLMERPPNEPVPVLFSVRGWDPESEPRVQDWLIAQLEQTYPVLDSITPDFAPALVEREMVLPLLDGLDEVPQARQARIIDALNKSVTGGVVLTSRRPEYRAAIAEAGDVLTGAAAVAPLALTPAEAATYLRRHVTPMPSASWEHVLSELAAGGATNLAQVTLTPLGLWLVRVVYVDGRLDPTDLVDSTYPTPAALQRHLLEQLISAVVRARPPLDRLRRNTLHVPRRPDREYDPAKLRTWLTTIASQFDKPDFRWWHLAQNTFSTTGARCAVRAGIALSVALASWLIVVAFWGLNFASTGAYIGGALILGLGTSLLTRGLDDRAPEPRHVTLRLRGRTGEMAARIKRSLTLAVACGLVLGVVFGVTTGVVGAVAVGSGWTLIQLLGSTDLARQVSSPAHSFVGDRTAAVITSLASSLLMGLTGGLTVGLTYGPRHGATAALALGLTFGLAYGLANYAWPSFVIAATWLALRRQLPWRLMPMLHDAHRLELLRTVGPVYQFRHAQLQDHLASGAPRRVD